MIKVLSLLQGILLTNDAGLPDPVISRLMKMVHLVRTMMGIRFILFGHFSGMFSSLPYFCVYVINIVIVQDMITWLCLHGQGGWALWYKYLCFCPNKKNFVSPYTVAVWRLGTLGDG